MFELKQFIVTVILWIQLYPVYSQQQFTVEPSDTEVVQGQTATLFCTVSNKSGSQTWVKDDTTPLNVDNNVIGGARYSLGGNQANGEYNLLISDTVASDAGTYACLVLASGSDSQIEASAVLTVIDQQSFTIEPANTNVFQGSTAILICNIANKQGRVQWLKESVPFTLDTTITSGENRYSIVGDQDNGDYNLQIIGAQEEDAGSYQCSVTATAEAAAISSSAVTLTVDTSGQRFLVIPSDTTTTEGSDVTFRCEVEDKVGTLSWLYNGNPISDDEFTDLDRHSITGNHTDGQYNLFISEVTQNEAGTYHCILNSDGVSDAASSSPALLIVLDAVAPSEDYPKCSIFPNSNLVEGQNVTLLCESEGGDPAAKLSWQVDQSLIDGDYVSEPNARNTLELQLVANRIGAEYFCRATHPTYITTKTCEIGALNFELNPTIEMTIEPARQEIIETKAGTIECSAVGDPDILGYKWYINGALINSSDSRFTIVTTGNEKTMLTIVSAQKNIDDALIRCEARNRLDTSTRTAAIQVLEEESDLYKYVLAVLCLIGIIVLAALIIGIVAAYCWRKNKKLNKVAPKDVEAVAMVEQPTGAVPPGPPKKKKRRKHKRRDRGSKVIEHVIHAENRGAPYGGTPYGGNYYVATKDGYDGYLPVNGYPGYPMFSYSPDIRTHRKGSYYINGGSKRGSYDLELARQKNGSITPRPSLTSSVNSKKEPVSPRPDSQRLSAVYSVSDGVRKGSVSPDRRRSSANPRQKISLSPGEIYKREEYEQKVQELEDMRMTMIKDSNGTKSRKHHKKHRKSKDAKV
ncbi:basement membrane-specific heparan sulfate proteoglycan core protein-like [Anneissia japonica]|uniref:basement membrane-specific heparan sulfate proteoglycan core protein-like n=1 Tax=Anneissia japonica TaxID=1529436 RepID=UPI0014257481|nr:basement membrane-specific heparan sulfate proteoglycan core protein-like [Anneissia japonica]